MAYNITKKSASSTTKKVLFFVAIIICLLIINNLTRSIYDLWHKQDLVVRAEKNLIKEKDENRRLKARLTFIKSHEFIESEARNKLFLVKPGESGVIVPSDLIKNKSKKKEVELPNWQKWLKLFQISN